MNLPNLSQMTTLLLTTPGCKRVTKYLSPTSVVKLTYRGKPQQRQRKDTIMLTIGAPNYLERKFIKVCKKTGEPFPVRKVQVYVPRAAR